jgi:hypothetical protein
VIDQLIYLIIAIVIFAIVAYGLNWIIVTYALPAPVKWIVGALLLIILLLFVSHQLGVGGGGRIFPAR